MCGIVGIISKDLSYGFEYKARDAFSDMLYMDALRGEDSTGVYYADKVGNAHWAKGVYTAEQFLTHKKGRDILNDIGFKGIAAVGHNRKATRGNIEDKNAHPFIEDNIILVHNGTLTNHKTLNSEVEVDSHAIAHAIKDHGVSDAIAKIQGAFAVAAYDVAAKELFLFRNAERPLYLVEGEKFFAFASEDWMLWGAFLRNGLSFKEAPHLLELNKLYTFSLDKTTNLTVTDVAYYTSPPAVFTKVETKQTTTPALPAPVGGASNVKTFPKSSTSSFGNWAKGDIINFCPQELQSETTGFKLLGEHFFFSNVEVVCYLSHSSITTAEANGLLNEKELCSVVTGVFFDSSSNKHIVYTGMPIAADQRISRNGVVVNEEMSMRISTCSECNELLDFETETEDMHVVLKPNGKLRVVCPVCVEKHLATNSRWGGLHETTSTSVQTLQ